MAWYLTQGIRTKLGDCGFKFDSGQLPIATSKKAISGEYYHNHSAKLFVTNCGLNLL